MTTMTDRERAVRDAARKYVREGHQHVEHYANEAGRFLAMYDAARRFDAEPAETPASPVMRLCGYCSRWASKPCGEGCHHSPKDPEFVPEPAKPAPSPSVVEAVREAMGRLPQGPHPTAPPGQATVVTMDLLRTGNGEWAENDAGFWQQSSKALATILNALPALLELAELGNNAHEMELVERAKIREAGFREGVVRGLERAELLALRRRDLLPMSDAAWHYHNLLATDIRDDAARIRSGGAIDTTETGGTPSADHGRTASAPEGQAQAGGVPGLPKGWREAGWIASLVHYPSPPAHVRRDLSQGEVATLCTMADAAIKLREAVIGALAELRSGFSFTEMTAIHKLQDALSSLEAPHG